MVYIRAAKNTGKDKIVNLLSRDGETTTSLILLGLPLLVAKFKLEFQKVVYDVNPQDKSNPLTRLAYPSKASSVDTYLEWKGLDSRTIPDAFEKWGFNEFDIPIPNFLDLYLVYCTYLHLLYRILKDHLVAPFFVFQVLCLFLWSLDDYWYYSVFTLIMLLFFEGIMCRQRQNSILMLRNMRRYKGV